MQSLETKSSRPRPKSSETETRPETFETETPKTGLETESRDSITGNQHFFLQWSSSFVWAATLKRSLQVSPTNTHPLGRGTPSRQRISVAGRLRSDKYCGVLFDFLPRICTRMSLSAPSTHVRAETSITGEVGGRWKADVWAQAKLGGRCNVLPYVHPCSFDLKPRGY